MDGGSQKSPRSLFVIHKSMPRTINETVYSLHKRRDGVTQWIEKIFPIEKERRVKKLTEDYVRMTLCS